MSAASGSASPPEHDDAVLAAGRFSDWLHEMTRALRDHGETAVPCGGCTACCRSSQFVHVGPDEAAALSRIPQELLFPAPGAPVGHLVMGYDEQGRCPMLADDECSIYEDRPRACRTYDCRIFAATGIDPDSHQPAIARRVDRWRFEVRDASDTRARDSLRALAAHLVDDPGGQDDRSRSPAVALAIRSVVEYDRAQVDAAPVPIQES